MLDLSCIIINYNTSTYTIPCVESIIAFNDRKKLSYEIIIIDNASDFTDYQILQRAVERMADPAVKLIRSKRNTGFGGGNMLGVQFAAPCKYYAFLNNDTLQKDPDCFLQLKHFMDKNKDIAVCSPQMLDEHENFRPTLDHFSSLQREIIKRSILEFLFPKRYLNRKKFYDKPTKVDYVQGSFLFIDADEFNDIGGFDTNLFLYYEESDLCRRFLKYKDKSTYLFPKLHYIHYKSASTRKNVVIKTELKISLLYSIRKHYGYWAYKTLLTHLQVRYFFTSFVKPQYFHLFKVLLRGAHLSESIKHKQKIKTTPE